MGLGKTVQVCAALSQLDRVALMVVSPAGVVHGWRRELTKWTTLEPRLVTRSSMRWPSAGQAILCSYDAARVGALKLGPAPKPDECTLVLVIDEVHRCKGARSAQTKACRAVAQAVDRSGGRAWLLSGTPLKNDHRELWNVLEVCGLGTVAFGSRERFAALATVEPEAYASRLRRVMLRRRKEDVLKDLPPIVPQDIQVELTEEVRAELDRVLSRIVEAAVSSARQRARRIASEAGISADLAEQQAQDAEQRARDDVGEALRMVLAGEAAVPFELISRAKALLSAAKLPSCLELLEDLAPSAEDPVVVFSAGAAVVSELGARDGWARIDGEVTGTARQKVIDRFARGELAGVAISIRAGGEGLDGLQRRASRAILNDREWTPADNAQAIGRLHRFGQQRSVHVYRLIAQHPLDERITELCEEKQATFAEAIDVIAQRGAGTDQKSMLAVLAEELEAAVGVPIVALPAAAAPAPEKIDAPPVVPATAAKQVVMPWGPHAPASDVERWAIDGLHKLVARTGRWSVRDTASQLLKDLKKQGGLTPEKWTWALRLCRGNPAIVGPEPIGSAK